MSEITLMQGDCLKLLPTLPDKSVDAIITDLPYGTTACKWDVIIPLDEMWKECERLIKPNGVTVFFGSEPFSSNLRISNLKMYKYDWYWKKNIPSGFQLANIQPQRCIENVMVFYEKQPTYNKQMRSTIINYRSVINGNDVKDRTKNEHNLGTKPLKIERRNTKGLMVNPVNFLDIKCVPRATGYLHPTQKPVELMEYLIRTYTNEGDTVLDFCMGSGTTGVACVKTNRNFIGMEKESNYFEIAQRRIHEAQQITMEF